MKMVASASNGYAAANTTVTKRIEDGRPPSVEAV
jgi:hypothetical protein